MLTWTARNRSELPSAERLADMLEAPHDNWRSGLSGRGGSIDDSPLVCTCFEVRQAAIITAIAAGATDSPALGKALRCGTNCGSCKPELNRLLATHGSVEAVAI